MVRPDAVAAVGAMAVLAAAHLAPPLLTFIRFEPRSRILSAGGGVSVAYVFVHLLPEVADAQAAVDRVASGTIATLERHAYVAALVGLVLFYGLERAALLSRPRARARDVDADDRGATTPLVFWLSISFFSLYNVIIAYLVVRRAQEGELRSLAFFTLALGVHFIVNDLGLRHHHKRRYDRLGRPILVAALAVGGAAAAVWQLPEAAVGLVVAFIGGSVVLNVMKEELPAERDSRFLAFAAGAAAYTILLVVS